MPQSLYRFANILELLENEVWEWLGGGWGTRRSNHRRTMNFTYRIYEATESFKQRTKNVKLTFK